MGNIFSNLDWSVVTNALLAIIPALICITFHELSHGYVAYRLGDDTAKKMGRLTLNPIKHIDIFGLVMMAVFRFGWAKPVPVNMMRFRYPKRYMAITALAGPVSNVLLAIIVFFIYGLAAGPLVPLIKDPGEASAAAYTLIMLYNTAYISVALAVFNLLPIPPLDGSKVLFSFIPDAHYYKLMRFERYGMILLIVIVTDVFGRVSIFSDTIGRGTAALLEKLAFFANAAYRLVN